MGVGVIIGVLMRVGTVVGGRSVAVEKEAGAGGVCSGSEGLAQAEIIRVKTKIRARENTSFHLQCGLQFLALTVEDDEHNDNTDNIHSQSNEHEGTLVAGEETGSCAEPEDGEHIGDVMDTAGDHRCCRCAAAGAHYPLYGGQRPTRPGGCDRDKQPEA